MGHSVKCIHCSTITSLIYKSVKSKSKRGLILLDNAPMHYCPHCNDSLISLETIAAFKYIRTLPLIQGEYNSFDYNTIQDKLSAGRTLLD